MSNLWNTCNSKRGSVNKGTMPSPVYSSICHINTIKIGVYEKKSVQIKTTIYQWSNVHRIPEQNLNKTKIDIATISRSTFILSKNKPQALRRQFLIRKSFHGQTKWKDLSHGLKGWVLEASNTGLKLAKKAADEECMK